MDENVKVIFKVYHNYKNCTNSRTKNTRTNETKPISWVFIFHYSALLSHSVASITILLCKRMLKDGNDASLFAFFHNTFSHFIMQNILYASRYPINPTDLDI